MSPEPEETPVPSMLHPNMDIDGNSPTTEGICQAYLQVMDAFDASQVQDLLDALRDSLGPEIPEASLDPDGPSRYRGGPYLIGGTHRRAWNLKWDALPPEMRRRWTDEEMERVRSAPGEVLVQWAENLPFAIVVVRTQPGQGATGVAYAAEAFLNALPGRLGPTNRIPRSGTQLVIAAKISEARMARLRTAMVDEDSETLRAELAGGLRLVGDASGDLHMSGFAPNLLHVEGQGSLILGDDVGLAFPFRAFVFSSGNLGPHKGWEWHMPMWIPPGLGTSDWSDFDFHPFLGGCIRNAGHVGVEAGRLDEDLKGASLKLPGSSQTFSASRVVDGLHDELVKMHTRLQVLATALHLGSTRSPFHDEQEWWPDQIQYRDRDEENRFFGRDSTSTESLKASKLQAEEDARQVLDGLERRIDRALDLVTKVENRQTNRSMRFWTMVAVLTAILVAALTRWGGT